MVRSRRRRTSSGPAGPAEGGTFAGGAGAMIRPCPRRDEVVPGGWGPATANPRRRLHHGRGRTASYRCHRPVDPDRHAMVPADPLAASAGSGGSAWPAGDRAGGWHHAGRGQLARWRRRRRRGDGVGPVVAGRFEPRRVVPLRRGGAGTGRAGRSRPGAGRAGDPGRLVLGRGDARGRDGGQEPAQDLVGGGALGQRLVGQHQAVAEDVGGDVEDVLGQHVVPAPQQRQGPAGGDQAEAGPGAGAVGDEGLDVGQPVAVGLPGGQHQVDGVVDDAAVDVDLVGRLLELQRGRRGRGPRAAPAGSTPMR